MPKCRKRLERNIQAYSHWSSLGLWYIFFSVFLNVLISLSLGYITFISSKDIHVIILKEKEVILAGKPATVPRGPGGERVVVAGCSWLLPAQAFPESESLKVDFPLYSQLEIRHGTKD